jgi:hypothetical protein
MADTQSRGTIAGLAFVVGALVVAVGVLGYFFWGGEAPNDDDVDIKIELPKVDVNGPARRPRRRNP